MTMSSWRRYRARLMSLLAVAALGLLATVTQAAPAAAQASSDCNVGGEATYGQVAALQVVVDTGGNSLPTGTVTLSVTGTDVTDVTQTITGTFTTVDVSDPTLTPNGWGVTGSYSGDANTDGSSCFGLLKITPASTTTALTSTPNPSAPGQQVNFIATVSAGGSGSAPTGSVNFYDGALLIGNEPVTGGSAVLPMSLQGLGAHFITATYSGDGNYTGSTSTVLTQNVVDNDLSIASAGNISVPATGPAGAVVSYTPPAVTDPDDATPPTAMCTPSPGSAFGIGTTTVTCNAKDSDDVNSPVSTSFTVTVVGAAGQLASLLTAVTVPPVGPGTSLADKVKLAQSYLASNNTAGACSTLAGFINLVSAQSGKSIPAGQAAQLIADATQIRHVLGC